MPFNGLLRLWDRTPRALVSGVLILATVVLFSRVFVCEFINLDDPLYVTENYHVQTGWTRENVAWSFTTVETGNWFPLTWLSLQLDSTLFGVNATAYHAVNLGLHVANSVLLFWALWSMTGALAPSAGVALLFAIHPLHVESVAWVSERKDVLSTFFWMLALIAYARYAEGPSLGRYVAVSVLFACGLCAKSMLVTFPCTLLLLDYWPLRRYAWLPADDPTVVTASRFSRASTRKLIFEKVPFFALSAVFSVIAVVAQARGHAVSSTELLPWTYRWMNAVQAYVAYLWKSLCPLELAIVYPHPLRNQSVGLTLGAAAVLAVVTFFILRRWRSQPYLVVGWFWYLGTLVPVIGLVQIGAQAMADRYTYVPLIGIFIAWAWSLAELVQNRRVSLRLAGVLSGAAFLSFGACTWTQVGYWRNDVTVWQHSIEVTGPHWQACHCLGDALLWRGLPREALPNLLEVVKLAPDLDVGHCSLGTALMVLGNPSAALAELEHAVRLNPQNADAHQNLAILLDGGGRSPEAIGHLQYALQLRPELWKAHLLFAEILKRQGQLGEADGHVRQALTINPHALEDIKQLSSQPPSSDPPPPLVEGQNPHREL